MNALHRYYASDVVVRSPASLVVGNEAVIAATMATQAELPDRLLLGEDVIWKQILLHTGGAPDPACAPGTARQAAPASRT